MDPDTLTVEQLKKVLRQRQLSITGRKAELIARMQQADPSGAWMKEAAQQHPEDDDEEEHDQEKGARQTRNDTHITVRANEDIARREAELMDRERDLMQREIAILRRENDMLRTSPRNNLSTVSRTPLNIKNVCEILSEYDGAGDDFERWKTQVNLLRDTYELDENAAKILVGSKLRGKAADWYSSMAEHLSMRVDRLLEKMGAMFDQPMSRLERKRIFENRVWKRNESFSDYCHDKIIKENKVPIPEEEMVEYIIDGIPWKALKNQARMQSFSTVHELTKAFRRITLEAPDTFQAHREASSPKNMKLKTASPKEALGGSPKPKTKGLVRCYQCDEVGHYAKDCPTAKEKHKKTSKDKKTERGNKKAERQVNLVDGTEQSASEKSESESDDQPEENDKIHFVDTHEELRDEFQRVAILRVRGGAPVSCTVRIDTGCPITLIQESVINIKDLKPAGQEWNRYHGINNSKLLVKGVIKANLTMDGCSKSVSIGVVSDNTMSIPLLIGRDTLKFFDYRLTNSPMLDKAVSEILLICNDSNNTDINVNPDLPPNVCELFKDTFINYYVKPVRPEVPEVQMEAKLVLKENKLVQFGPRRLGYAEKEKLRQILNDLLKRNIIRESVSEYASPIVLVRKKNGEIRMCIDYRAVFQRYLSKTLSKVTAPDPEPEPVPESLEPSNEVLSKSIEPITGSEPVTESSADLEINSEILSGSTASVPDSESVSEPHPADFEEVYVGNYIDDVVIATKTLKAHIDMLKKVFTVLVNNKLELKLEKCVFIYTEVEYLGYKVSERGIQPTDRGIRAVQNFPEPKTVKEVHSFVGLASYFRRFIRNFSIIARPLYNLIRKDVAFEFGECERNAFITLKSKLIEAPILAVYNPKASTELHCDASMHGFGAILMQKQDDNKMHPVFYFSRRTTEVETRYHSFELETLAI
ncbi:uncharacterized protein LOC112465625, partial [Temnothorax curvispinosus]|uniref:Uncharacterized protein LOC112465625 n=1 Tax=Temnothorax curvispinosus TaxID=300111 RepID=A0A6J1R4B2_9HYME